MSRSIGRALIVLGFLVAFLPDAANAEIKRVIAVAPVDWRAPQVDWTSEGAIEAQLIEALKDSGRWRVVERMDVDSMLGEQTIAGGGGLKAFKGAQMYVKPVVTEAALESGSGRNIRFGGVGGSKEDNIFKVTLNMRIYDVQTGDILDTVTVTGRQQNKTTNRGGSFGNWDVGKTKTGGDTTGEITRDLIERAVEALDTQAYDVRWASTIKTVSGGKAVMMGGKRDGVEKGMVFEVYKLGAPIIDEDTGEILDAGEEMLVGKAKAVQVKEKITFLGRVSGDAAKKGDVVKLIEPDKPAPKPKAQAQQVQPEPQPASSGGKKKRRK